MAVTFDILPAARQPFLAPYVALTAVDTTEAVSAVSAWNWYFNNSLVGLASTWNYTFFGPIPATPLYLVASTPYGSAASLQQNIFIEDFQQVPSFIIEPVSPIAIGDQTLSITITARDTTPSTYGVTGWQWSFNGVNVSSSSSWIYTFFNPITGTVQLTTTSSTTTASTVLSQSLVIENTLNGCNQEPILPAGVRGSTTYNHVITSFDLLAQRLKYQIGFPVTQVELCDDMIYDFINQAIEWYSKYAGYTEEYLMFDAARVYQCGLGMKLDTLFSSYYTWSCGCASTNANPIGVQSASQVNNTITPTTCAQVMAQFYDCDMNEYRKVIDVFSVDPVASTGIDTLFSMDYMFAQQTYFSYMLGSFGWDLVTWHILKDFLKVREKLFATRPYIRFDPRTQIMRIIPEPVGNSAFYGVIGAYVERPIKDLVKERWVQQYALALMQIALAHVRGKFGQVTLFGGGTLVATDLMTQGLEMKKQLENELMNTYGEVMPISFYHY